MQKQAPSLGRILVMAGFTLSVFGLLLFLWLSFGGAIPLRPEGYRVKAAFPEAAQLALEADVRISGIDVGKVKELDFSKDPPATIATIELDSRFAPLPRDVRAILRQKTLLGETYVELTPGSRGGPTIDDGGSIASAQVERKVELDEILQVFDEPTREAFQTWQAELAKSVKGGGDLGLNEGFGHLAGFAEGGADLLAVLDRREEALGRLVRNTGVVFGALSAERGRLRSLIQNSNRLFETTASRDDALARTIEIFPTFLDESRSTLARLEGFAQDTRPLVRDLRPVARELTPTLRDTADLAPDLEDLFRDLDALNDVAPRTLPDAERFIDGAAPVLEALHPFLQELNPIVTYANFNSPLVADFITVGGAALATKLEGGNLPGHMLRQIGMINSASLALNTKRPAWERANAYLAPNAFNRMRAAGVLESFDCTPAGGEKVEPTDGSPPCLLSPPSLWDNNRFPTIEKGESPLVPPPSGNEGTEPVLP